MFVVSNYISFPLLNSLITPLDLSTKLKWSGDISLGLHLSYEIEMFEETAILKLFFLLILRF